MEQSDAVLSLKNFWVQGFVSEHHDCIHAKGILPLISRMHDFTGIDASNGCSFVVEKYDSKFPISVEVYLIQSPRVFEMLEGDLNRFG